MKAFIFLIFVSQIRSQDLTKLWKFNTNFDNPDNWDPPHIPCPNDNIIFPEVSPVVRLTQDSSMSQLTLPSSGVILLENNLIISFDDSPLHDDSCPPGHTSVYNRAAPKKFLSAVNWCLPKHDFDSDCLEDVLPESHQVPCEYDDVVFPELASFYVALNTPPNYAIRSLRIGYTYYVTSSLSEYLTTDIGRRQFATNITTQPVLDITQESCTDSSGCLCGTEHMMDTVCEGYTCPPVPCSTPVSYEGGCCTRCGAVLTLGYTKRRFDIVAFRLRIQSDYISHEADAYNGVHMMITKTTADKIQVVMLDKSQGQRAAALGLAVKGKIDQDSVFRTQLGVTEVTGITHSELEPTPIPSTSSTTTLLSSSSIGTVPIVTTPTKTPTKKPSTSHSTANSFTPPVTPKASTIKAATTPITSSAVPQTQTPTGGTGSDSTVTGTSVAHSPSGQKLTSPKDGETPLHTIVGIVIAVMAAILIASIAIIYVVLTRFRNRGSLWFNKDEDTHAIVRAEFGNGGDGEASIGYREQAYSTFGQRATDTPMTTFVSTASIKVGKKQSKGAGFDNPLYDDSILERDMFDNPEDVGSSS